MLRDEVVRSYIYSLDGDVDRVNQMQELMMDMVPNDYHEKCTSCRIHEECHAPVPGVGNVYAKVVFIGRNPGGDEDMKGIPFIGNGGKLLDLFIRWVGLDRSDIYLTNMVKCFTSIPENNRPPKSDEIQICTDKWLKPELALLKPVILITLGKEVCQLMTGQDLSFARGRMQTYEAEPLLGVNVISCIHPGAALRSERYYGELRKDADFVRVKCRELGLVI